MIFSGFGPSLPHTDPVAGTIGLQNHLFSWQFQNREKGYTKQVDSGIRKISGNFYVHLYTIYRQVAMFGI